MLMLIKKRGRSNNYMDKHWKQLFFIIFIKTCLTCLFLLWPSSNSLSYFNLPRLSHRVLSMLCQLRCPAPSTLYYHPNQQLEPELYALCSFHSYTSAPNLSKRSLKMFFAPPGHLSFFFFRYPDTPHFDFKKKSTILFDSSFRYRLDRSAYLFFYRHT